MDTQQEKIGIFRSSYALAKKSLSLIRQDHHIIIFPVLFGLLAILFLTGFFVLRFLFLGEGGTISVGTILFLSFIVIFLSVFMKIAVTLCLRSYLAKKPITAREAFRRTGKKIDFIFRWALCSSFVGLFLLILPFDFYSTIFFAILSVYWSLATYFIIPALSEENTVFSESFSYSIQSLKKSFGEMIIINVAFVFLFAFMVILTITILADFIILFPLIALAMPIFAGFSILCIAMFIFFLALLIIFSVLYQASLILVLYNLSAPEHKLLAHAVKRSSGKKIV